MVGDGATDMQAKGAGAADAFVGFGGVVVSTCGDSHVCGLCVLLCSISRSQAAFFFIVIIFFLIRFSCA
jgi:hypothetical protein